jgi:hypothetical protein
MWNSTSDNLQSENVLKVTLFQGTSRVTFAEVISLWQHDQNFRTFFIGLLADCPYSAFRWETPAVSLPSIHQPFEFVMLNSPGLAAHPDQSAFDLHFAKAGSDGVVAFPNLGGDAVLIVPCPLTSDSAYGHIAAFHRNAPEAQKHALWKLVGSTLHQCLGPTCVWLSTAGAGVSWLHVRLDRTPKYYGYAAYRQSK